MENQIVEQDLQTIIKQDLPWGDLEGQTILITGANGFLPAYLVKTLLYLNDHHFTRKAKVIGLVRNQKKALARFVDNAGRSDFELLIQDVCQPIPHQYRPDYLIHAASQASPKYYGCDPVGTLRANAVGTYQLLEFARTVQVKGFLFLSSGEVYGEVDSTNLPLKEDCYGWVDPTRVRSCYAESKRMGENMCVSWHHQFQSPTKIARPFHTYGPGMLLDDGRVYADFIADVIQHRDVVMKSDGLATRSFCYLADAAAGFFTVLLKGQDGEAYNVGSDRETSILELAEIMVRLFPERGLKVTKQARGGESAYLESKISRLFPDITRVRALGWEPQFSLAEGLIRTVRSWEEQ